MDNIDDLAAEVDKLKSVFQKFDEKNTDFAATLSDDNDLDECEDYFSEVQNNFIKVLEQVKRILHVCSPVIQTPAQSPTGSNLAKLLGAVNLPKVEIRVFSGDPSQFHQFMKTFELNVDTNCTDDSLKLTRLLQYTTGPAHDTIKGCVLAGGTDGYKQAIDILNERFGNPHPVSDITVRNLKLGKQIKTPFELRQLSDDVKNAKLVLTKLDMMAEVSCQAVFLTLWIVCRIISKTNHASMHWIISVQKRCIRNLIPCQKFCLKLHLIWRIQSGVMRLSAV